jgi:hypothetical protein
MGAAGKRSWALMKAALPAACQYDEREMAILERARRQTDVAEFGGAIRRHGVVATGSQRQRVLNG